MQTNSCYHFSLLWNQFFWSTGKYMKAWPSKNNMKARQIFYIKFARFRIIFGSNRITTSQYQLYLLSSFYTFASLLSFSRINQKTFSLIGVFARMSSLKTLPFFILVSFLMTFIYLIQLPWWRCSFLSLVIFSMNFTKCILEVAFR